MPVCVLSVLCVISFCRWGVSVCVCVCVCLCALIDLRAVCFVSLCVFVVCSFVGLYVGDIRLHSGGFRSSVSGPAEGCGERSAVKECGKYLEAFANIWQHLEAFEII